MKQKTTVYYWALPLIVVAFAIDRVSKWWAVERLAPETIELIPGWFDLTYVPNYNIVFYFNLPVWVMIAIVGVVTALLLVVAAQEYVSKRHCNVIWLALILAGAFSNALDRIQIGAVIDFFRIPFWTIFNFADLYILAGAVAIIIANRLHTSETKQYN